MKTENFAAHGVNEFAKGRVALVRSTVALAVGYQVARGLGAEEPNTMAGEAFKVTLKKLMRDAGNDRKTADRHVNTALSLSAKLCDRWSSMITSTQTEVAIVDAITQSAVTSGAKSVAALKRLVQTGSADQAEEDGESKAERAVRLEKEAETAADLLAGRINNADLDAATPVAETVSQIETQETEADAPEDNGFAFLQDMDTARLQAMIDAAQAEIDRRMAAESERLAG